MDENTTRKTLYRSKSDRMISGVCGGLAEYFNIDATLIRVAWVASVFFGGVGLLLYLAAIIIVPENPDEIPAEKKSESGTDKNLFWGSLLIIVGLLFLFRQFGIIRHFDFFHFDWQFIWAVILIALGIFLLFNMKSSPRGETGNAADTGDERHIYRSRADRKLAGVCAGLGQYFNMDANLVRLIYVLLTFASMGFGILAYIVMVIVFPEEPLYSGKEEK